MIRVLLVDDFKPWREKLRRVLDKRPDLVVVGEAADGLEAVRRAGALKPDLVILDIGLPNMNGLIAATFIRKSSPESKIIFVTLNSDPAIVATAISTGAHGFVLKSDAGHDLLPGIAAVLCGQSFTSSRLSGANASPNQNQLNSN